jgi:penicillin-binding protein 1C
MLQSCGLLKFNGGVISFPNHHDMCIFPSKLRKRKHILLWLTVFIVGLSFWFCLPNPLFNSSYSTALYSQNGSLLSAIIAEDQQWRFPELDSVPLKFAKAIVAFEDRHFYDHGGVYLPSVANALIENLRGVRKRGASTITMQVIRLSRGNPERTISEKCLEIFMAMRLELTNSKEEILGFYASHAPFGGNVVGLDAAAWRYFGRTPNQLSWAEAATLAVLPNAPSLIFPGKNEEKLLEKRNRLLEVLHLQGEISTEQFSLAKLEPLPQKPHPLPQEARHLLNTTTKIHGKGKRFYTTINSDIQRSIAEVVTRHNANLRWDQINNMAVLVLDAKTGNVISYIGNSADASGGFGNDVDIVQARRSTGSILKPFLYAAMLEDGLMLPKTLYSDYPIQYDGFSPKNFSESYDGAVPASLALTRSLNVPSVIMLQEYNFPRFYHLLKRMNFRHLDQPAEHYGLSLILGGAEASLWDITQAYASLAQIVLHWNESNGKYDSEVWSQGTWLAENTEQKTKDGDAPIMLSAGSVYTTYESLLQVNRPDQEMGWESYSSSQPIAWKTGTSFGNRDAWSIGTTPEYVVGVWVGNHDGQGRPNLTGTAVAAPVMFDVFDCLEKTTWFSKPFDDLIPLAVCRESGMKSGLYCGDPDTIYVPIAGKETELCTYHKRVHLSQDGKFRVTQECSHEHGMQEKDWFVLKPVQSHYFKIKHPTYQELPPFAAGCGEEEYLPIALIYPKSDMRLYLSRGFEGKIMPIVLEATHSRPKNRLFWHLDNEYIGETWDIHKMSIEPKMGKHLLTLVDSDGNRLEKWIEIVQTE